MSNQKSQEAMVPTDDEATCASETVGLRYSMGV